MRTDGFCRSLAFAAVAALALVPWLVFVRPVLGGQTALALYLVAAVALYLAGLAAAPSRTLVALLAAGAGLGVAALARSSAELALGLGILLAVGRSGCLRRLPLARALAVESLVTGGGLLFARWLADPSPLGVVVTLWAFFLVQGFYFLTGPRPAVGAARRDAFEEAHARALALLERGVS